MDKEPLMIFSGSGSRVFCSRICAFLGTAVRKSEAITFSDGNTFVRVGENVRGRDVFIVQSVVHKTNDYFMELLFWVDAFKRASAASVTAVIPFFGYGKGDKKDEPRVSIRARVCADALEAAGVDRIVTMDLHAPQIQGFFRVPVDNLYGHPTLSERLRELVTGECVVVAPDTGFAEEAHKYAEHLGMSVAIGDKERQFHDERAHVRDVIGEVKGKNAIIVDDFVVSAGTLAEVAHKLREKGAARILAAVTHGVFSAQSLSRIDDSPIEKIIVTDTVENHPSPLSAKVECVSAAPSFGEAIKRIHKRESISEMFT